MISRALTTGGVAAAVASILASLTPVRAVAAAAEAQDQLEEITVTARKVEENLQDVPVSVQAVTADQLQMRSLDSLSAVGQSTPNLSFGEQAQSGSSASVVYIRGVGQRDTLAAFDPGVGIYIDGVYLGRMTATDLDTMDVERVEILRGPQGTLFGKNTNGGAISIVTRKPDVSAEKADGRLQVTGGSRDRMDVIAGVNLPLVADKAALQISGSHRQQDGYSHRVDGQDQADKDRWNGRMSLVVKPSENFEALLSGDFTSFNQATSAYRLVAVREASVVPTVYALFTPFRYDNRWVADNPLFYNGTGANRNDGNLWGTSLTLTWDQDWATIKSISSYRKSDIHSELDADGSPLTVLNVFEKVDQHQFAQEFQATGEAIDNRLKWVTGLYYFTEKAQDDNSFEVAHEFFGGAADFFQNLGIRNDSYAVYGQGTYALTDRLNFTAGARVTRERKEIERVQGGQETIKPHKSWTKFLPRLGFDYHFTPQIMGYVSAAEGSKSGGFNGRAASVIEFNRFDPERVRTYELGLRSDWLEKRLRFNATAFYSDYSDMQIQINASITDPNTGQPVPFNIVGNIPSTDIVGGELELTVIPVDGLTLTGNLGLANGKYKKLIPGAPVDRGDEFVNTPKVAYTFSAEYGGRLTGRYSLTGRVDYSHKSRIQFDQGNSPLVDQSPYGLVNARLALDIEDSGLSFALFGTNLTNKHYAVGGHDDGVGGSLGFVLQQMGAPREWGVTAEYRF